MAAARRAIAAFDLTRPAEDPAAAAAYLEGARQVSVAQRLPQGSYDFTRISAREMTIVGGAMIASGTVRPAALAGVLDLAGGDATSDVPINFLAYLHQQAAENEARPGGMATAFQQRTAQSVLKRQQVEQGIPITYDDRYPTAPHGITAEEATAKLKAAITAFRKEATLTPAQRIRRDVLKDMKLTEDELKAMPQSKRETVEKTITDEVSRRLRLLGLPESGGASDAAAADGGEGVAAGTLA